MKLGLVFRLFTELPSIDAAIQPTVRISHDLIGHIFLILKIRSGGSSPGKTTGLQNFENLPRVGLGEKVVLKSRRPTGISGNLWTKEGIRVQEGRPVRAEDRHDMLLTLRYCPYRSFNGQHKVENNQ